LSEKKGKKRGDEEPEGTPARSAAVGKKSQNAQEKPLLLPGWILPGHRTMLGLLIPPSYRLLLNPLMI